MSAEDKLHTDELSDVINSPQTWSLEVKQREMLESKVNAIIRGFSIPYPHMATRRRLKKIMTLIIDDDAVWKIKPSEDLRLKCEDILSQL